MWWSLLLLSHHSTTRSWKHTPNPLNGGRVFNAFPELESGFFSNTHNNQPHFIYFSTSQRPATRDYNFSSSNSKQPSTAYNLPPTMYLKKLAQKKRARECKKKKNHQVKIIHRDYSCSSSKDTQKKTASEAKIFSKNLQVKTRHRVTIIFPVVRLFFLDFLSEKKSL